MTYCADRSPLVCTVDHSENHTLSLAAGSIIIRSVFHTKFVVWFVYLHTADRRAPGIVTRRSTGQTRLREWLVHETIIIIMVETQLLFRLLLYACRLRTHRAAPLDRMYWVWKYEFVQLLLFYPLLHQK